MTLARAAALARTVLFLVGLAACGVPPVPDTIVVEDVVSDLTTHPGSRPAAGRTIATLDPGDRLRADQARTSVIVPPGATQAWRVEIPPDAVLRFGLGVEGDKRRDPSRSGLVFTIAVDGTPLFSRTVNPAASRDDRRWWDERLPLGAHAGRTVELTASVATDTPDREPAGRAGLSRVRIARETRVARRPASDGVNLLVVLVDTLRADAVGLHGAVPSPTPHLDRFAGRGLVFDTALSQCSWTLPSVATLLSGLPPRQHGAIGQHQRRDDRVPVDARGGSLADHILTWPEAAAHAGLTTFGASANPLVSHGTNLAQGFETFIHLPWDPKARNWSPADDVHAAFLTWLERHRDTRFVAYLQVMEPHDPYTPPDPPPAPPGLRPSLAAGWIRDVANKVNWGHGTPLSGEEIAYVRQLYLGDVAAWDRAFGGLLERLEAMRLLDRTVVIVTADHGDEFQEHGRLTHGSHLYEETVRVPLVIVGPGVPPGRRADLAQGIDLYPTVARLLGLSAAGPGRDLLAGPRDQEAVLETSSGIASDGSSVPLVALRAAGTKLIETSAAGRAEFYDLASDPGERQDRGATDVRTEAAKAHLDAWRAATPIGQAPGGPDPAFDEKLRALGYVE